MVLLYIVRRIARSLQNFSSPHAPAMSTREERDSPSDVPTTATVNEITITEGLNWQTKEGRNLIFIMFLGLSCTLDYCVTNLSIQPYYSIISNLSTQASNLYGLANGSYFLAQCFFAPVFGYFVDKTRSYKSYFLIGVLMQAGGNVLYALLYLIDVQSSNANLAWRLMIVSRLIQGAGASIVITGTAYITTHTSMSQRASVLGTYRYSQVITRFIGSFLAFCFIGITEPTPTSSTALQVLNFYTMGAWTAVLLCSITVLACLVLFEDFDETHISNAPHPDDALSLFEFVSKCESTVQQSLHQTTAAKQNISTENIIQKIPGSATTILGNTSVWYFVISCNTIQIMFTMAVYSIFSQVFGIALAVYFVITNQFSVYKPWLPFGVGSMTSTYLWKTFNPRLGPTPEKVFTNAGITLAMVGLIFLIPYLGANNAPPQPLMYVGFTFMGICISWFNVNQEIVFSRQISWMTHVNGSNRDGTFLSLYMMVNSFGNFLGPFLVGYAMVIQQNPSSDSLCYITSTTYESAGCELTNYGAWVGGMIATLGLCLVLNFYFDTYVVDYTTDPSQLNEVGGRLCSPKFLKDVESSTDQPQLIGRNERASVSEVGENDTWRQTD